MLKVAKGKVDWSKQPADRCCLMVTLLHLMGLDYPELTYRYSGSDYRPTDVDGHVVKPLFA